MRLFVCGGAGFIGSDFIRRMLAKHADWEIVCYDKLTYAGNLDNLLPVAEDPRYSFVRGCICSRDEVDGGARRGGTRRRDRELRRRDARRPLDRLARGLPLHRRHRHPQPARTRARARHRAHGAGLDRRGLRLHRVRLVLRDRPAAAVEPVLGVQGRAATCRCSRTTPRTARRRSSRAARTPTGPTSTPRSSSRSSSPTRSRARSCRSTATASTCATGCTSTTTRTASRPRCCAASPGRSTTSAVATSARTARSRPSSSTSSGSSWDDSVRQVTDRPGHDRRYSISCERARRELGWEPVVDFEAGLRETIRWYRDNEPVVEQDQARDRRVRRLAQALVRGAGLARAVRVPDRGR